MQLYNIHRILKKFKIGTQQTTEEKSSRGFNFALDTKFLDAIASLDLGYESQWVRMIKANNRYNSIMDVVYWMLYIECSILNVIYWI